jgi:chemotaxis protein MotB
MPKRRNLSEDEAFNESWLIPYADILTLLLALFIVLFASSTIDTTKFQQMMDSFNLVLTGGHSVMEIGTIVPIGDEMGLTRISGNRSGLSAEIAGSGRNTKEDQLSELQERIREETEQLERLKQSLDAYITENELASQLSTELNNMQLVLRISDNALFASGSAEVSPEGRRLALAIADMLTAYPQYEVVVSGHTDNVPIHNERYRDNWDLSTARALNFMKILLGNKELDPSRFSSIGFGEYRPVADNDTPEGRAKNRRVEVSIIRNVVVDEPEMLDAGNP